MKIEDKLTASVINGVKELYGAEVPAKMVQLQKTKKEFEGHLTLVVFPFLKMSKKGPEQTAQEIGEYLKKNEPAIANYNVIKGFLNLTIASDVWIELLNRIHADAQWGIQKATEDAPLVMIEYSSPNTNKPLHLGHVRNNLLGNALANVMAANGNKVVKTNIVNDRGIHICKSMLAWLKYGNGETPESSGKKGDHLIGDYYVAFDKHYKAEVAELMEKGLSKEEAEAQSPLMQEAREMLRKWEANDPEIRALWKKMNDWVYAGFDETYKMMGVSFDKIYYESETYLEGKEKGRQQQTDSRMFHIIIVHGIDISRNSVCYTQFHEKAPYHQPKSCIKILIRKLMFFSKLRKHIFSSFDRTGDQLREKRNKQGIYYKIFFCLYRSSVHINRITDSLKYIKRNSHRQ